MLQALKDKWIKALRSGKYAQTTEHLHTNFEEDGGERYCCLGVLCEIAGIERFDVGDELDNVLAGYAYGPDRDDLDLGEELKAELNFVRDTMEFVEWNDTAGYNFNQIADEIEKIPAEEL